MVVLSFPHVTAMVGAGVLSLPYAMSELGWGPGVTVLVISWIITLYTLWQMVEMHEMVPRKRFNRYHELGQHAFGEKLGLWIVVPQQLVVEVGVDIVYMVTGGKSLKKFHDIICTDCKEIKLTYFIMIFASVHFVLSHLPNFNSMSGVSLAAAVMSLSALGDVTFAYAGHNVVLEIQATMPSTLETPSKKPMWKGVIVAYIVVAVCYFPVALIGYWTFGNTVEDNILVSLKKPVWLIAMANMFVVVHVIGSYQIYAMPVFDMIETVLVRKLRFKPTWWLRFISRNIYVGFTMFVAMTLPFSGGFAFAPTTYFIFFRHIYVYCIKCDFHPQNKQFKQNSCTFLTASLYNVALHPRTEEVQPVLVHQLDLHNPWSSSYDYSTNWRAEADYTEGKRLSLLLISMHLPFSTIIHPVNLSLCMSKSYDRLDHLVLVSLFVPELTLPR
ncbi:Lysine histidine transporter 1 [Sesamum angolense]|uniref:Lysine histidine transporter 1 n=1 Tax=Sesamum angolense TaxID=2727404 RepID=A0AAE2C5L6_9LAMI|nr:Lysine histidine transporter 1 [Sesamum angolense]